MRPAGSIGMFRPDSWHARQIARHEGTPYSHALVALGDGRAFEAVFPRVQIRDEPTEADWWEPLFPVDGRALRSAAYMAAGRIRYDWWEIVRRALPLVFGMPTGRSRGLYCSELVAEMLLVGADYDISRTMEPWSVGVRDLLLLLRARDSDFRRQPVEAP